MCTSVQHSDGAFFWSVPNGQDAEEDDYEHSLSASCLSCKKHTDVDGRDRAANTLPDQPLEPDMTSPFLKIEYAIGLQKKASAKRLERRKEICSIYRRCRVLAHRPCPKLEMFCRSVLQLFYGCSKVLMTNHGMSFLFLFFCFSNRLEIRAQLP